MSGVGGARPRRPRSIGGARLAVAVVAVAGLAAGCRTRLYDVAWPEPPGDGFAGDGFAGVDFARAPDLAVTDLPPPRDLTLPFVCRDIWVVDEDRQLYGFDTASGGFDLVGTLRCPSPSAPQTMAIGRDGTAWVLYSNGELFRVDVRDASCAATAFDSRQLSPDGAHTLLGSAFSLDSPGGEAETYFVAVTRDALSGQAALSTIDTSTLRVSPAIMMAGPLELTGTAAAELWGFFPNDRPTIARIDKRTGATDRALPLPPVMAGSAAFAFAFWGGSFYVFHAPSSAPGESTSVYRADLDGQVRQVREDTGLHIVGAGASTCAPLGLDQ